MVQSTSTELIEMAEPMTEQKNPRYYAKTGNLSARAKALKDKVLAVLEADRTKSYGYSDIAKTLIEQYPDNYSRDGNDKNYLSNSDVKFVVGVLVQEGGAVDK